MSLNLRVIQHCSQCSECKHRPTKEDPTIFRCMHEDGPKFGPSKVAMVVDPNGRIPDSCPYSTPQTMGYAYVGPAYA